MRFGFSSDELSIKILILYVLDKLLPGDNKAATHDELQKLVFIDENTDYFMFASALRELVDTQYLQYDRSNEIDMFKITKAGRNAANTMAAKLPAALRDECDRQVAQMIERKALGESVCATVTERSREYVIHLQLTDGALLVFNLDMVVGDTQQAQKILKKFQNKPNEIYMQVLELLDR